MFHLFLDLFSFGLRNLTGLNASGTRLNPEIMCFNSWQFSEIVVGHYFAHSFMYFRGCDKIFFKFHLSIYFNYRNCCDRSCCCDRCSCCCCCDRSFLIFFVVCIFFFVETVAFSESGGMTNAIPKLFFISFESERFQITPENQVAFCCVVFEVLAAPPLSGI